MLTSDDVSSVGRSFTEVQHNVGNVQSNLADMTASATLCNSPSYKLPLSRASQASNGERQSALRHCVAVSKAETFNDRRIRPQLLNLRITDKLFKFNTFLRYHLLPILAGVCDGYLVSTDILPNVARGSNGDHPVRLPLILPSISYPWFIGCVMQYSQFSSDAIKMRYVFVSEAS